MSTSGLKAIAPVPKASDFLDIVLSKTQRKTPTVRAASFEHRLWGAMEELNAYGDVHYR